MDRTRQTFQPPTLRSPHRVPKRPVAVVGGGGPRWADVPLRTLWARRRRPPSPCILRPSALPIGSGGGHPPIAARPEGFPGGSEAARCRPLPPIPPLASKVHQINSL